MINEECYVEGVSGKIAKYRPCYVELLFIFYKLLGWGLRQLTGYVEDMWGSHFKDIDVPSFGHLSELFKELPLKVKHYCSDTSRRLEKGESVTLIADSTGLRTSRESPWLETKYNQPLRRRQWRKLHIGIEPGMEVLSVGLTEHLTDDREKVEDLTNLKGLDKFIADRGYYSHAVIKRLYEKGIAPVIPPPSHATIHGKEDTY